MFMYSYEGTGRSLSHKLLKSLREKSVSNSGAGIDVTVKKLVDKLKGKERSGPLGLSMYIYMSVTIYHII